MALEFCEISKEDIVKRHKVVMEELGLVSVELRESADRCYQLRSKQTRLTSLLAAWRTILRIEFNNEETVDTK